MAEPGKSNILYFICKIPPKLYLLTMLKLFRHLLI